MKALVTGGAGFIGSHVVDRLIADGCDVIVFDDFSTGRREFVNPAAVLVEGDIRDQGAIAAAMRNVETVFHFAANADVRGGIGDTAIDLDKNTIATHRVLEAARLNRVRSFFFASSAAVYGEPEIFPTPETLAPVQTSLYGASKLACEAMLEAYAEYFDMRGYSFRFVSWIGERYSHGVVFDFMRKLMQDSTSLEILGDGKQRKSYLYVKDGVNAILSVLHEAKAAKGLFNLGHDESLTVRDVADVVCSELELRNVEYRFTGGARGWVGDSPFVHLDTGRIKELGWSPSVSIEDGLRRTVRFLRDNPHLLSARA